MTIGAKSVSPAVLVPFGEGGPFGATAAPYLTCTTMAGKYSRSGPTAVQRSGMTAEFDALPSYVSAKDHAEAAADTPVKASVLAALELMLQKLGKRLRTCMPHWLSIVVPHAIDSC